MTPSESSRDARWSLATRCLALALAGALGAAAIAEHRRWSAQRAELVEELTVFGLAERSPEVVRDVAREPDRRRAALRAARGLLADELDRRWQAELAPGELGDAQSQGLTKLARASAIAAAALEERPASWQAAEVLGATRYLETLRRRQPMTTERRDAWRRPLLAARVLGPGQPEPARFLAAATLSEWSRLPTGERDEAIGLLREAFADPATFDLLAASWLRIAPSREQAFSVVPLEPRAWAAVKSFYAGRGDWDAFARAHQRQREALFDRLTRRLELAAKRLAGGDRRRARWYALEVIETAPVDLDFAPLLDAALEILPPGPLGAIRARRIGEWLTWSRERCLLGECPFGQAELARMAGFAPLLEPADLAAAAELGGDWRAGELYARQHDLLAETWAPYHLMRARRLASMGDRDGARRVLERVHSAWRGRAAFRETAALASAAGHAGNVGDEGDAGDAAERTANGWRRRHWPADSWRDDARPTLEIYSGACDRLELVLTGIAVGGSALDVLWDGRFLGTYPVYPGQPLRLALTIDPSTPHQLTIDPFAHPQIRPGIVRLRDCSS